MDKKKLQKEKVTIKNTSVNLVIILLLATIIVSAVIELYAWAKYRSAIGGVAEATVAKWSFKVNGSSQEAITIDMTETMSDTHGKVADKKIAPGTNGSFTIEIDASGSEVAVEYSIKMNITELPRNLKLYRDEAHSDIIIANDGGIINIENYIDLANINQKVLYTIYWDWPYITGTTEEDIKANDIIDTEDSGKTCHIPITIIGVQANPNIIGFAKDKLIVNSSATEVEEKSPYVNYVDGHGNTILCRVLYNDVTHGIQLIAANPVRQVKLGKDDELYTGGTNEEKERNSYNNAIINLNNYATEYLNTNLATDARSVGSIGTVTGTTMSSKNSESGYYSGTESYQVRFINGKYKDGDTNRLEDLTRLKDLGMEGFTDTTYGDYYWLASRHVDQNPSKTNFDIRYVQSDGTEYSIFIVYIDSNGWQWVKNDVKAGGLRPIFLLKSNVKVMDGRGTEDDPYTLGK